MCLFVAPICKGARARLRKKSNRSALYPGGSKCEVNQVGGDLVNPRVSNGSYPLILEIKL